MFLFVPSFLTDADKKISCIVIDVVTVSYRSERVTIGKGNPLTRYTIIRALVGQDMKTYEL